MYITVKQAAENGVFLKDEFVFFVLKVKLTEFIKKDVVGKYLLML